MYIIVEHVYLKFKFSKMCDVCYVHTTDKSISISNNDKAKRILRHPVTLVNNSCSQHGCWVDLCWPRWVTGAVLGL
jgi:hypothetical protein